MTYALGCFCSMGSYLFLLTECILIIILNSAFVIGLSPWYICSFSVQPCSIGSIINPLH
jgi:hypothetical protein